MRGPMSSFDLAKLRATYQAVKTHEDGDEEAYLLAAQAFEPTWLRYAPAILARLEQHEQACLSREVTDQLLEHDILNPLVERWSKDTGDDEGLPVNILDLARWLFGRLDQVDAAEDNAKRWRDVAARNGAYLVAYEDFRGWYEKERAEHAETKNRLATAERERDEALRHWRDTIQELQFCRDTVHTITESPYAIGIGRPVPGSEANPGAEMSIEELELSVRAYNCLKRANIYTVGDLLKKTERELMDIKNFGKKSAEEVIERLRAYGFTMAAGEPSESEYAGKWEE